MVVCVKTAAPRISLCLITLALGPIFSSCASNEVAANENAASPPAGVSEPAGENLLYRPVNGSWTGHWTPDRSHAEDHLRAHNAGEGVSGGVIEYQ